MNIKFKPLGDKILIEPKLAPEKVGRLYLPENAKEKPQEGKVIAIGEGRINDRGERLPMSVCVGDRVLMARYCGTEIKIDGKEYRIISVDDVFGILL
jgi:chaperonin GroES